MEKVQFEEPRIENWRPAQGSPGGLTGFLIKHGWAKDLAQANLLLIIVIILSMAFIIFYWSGEEKAKLVPDSQILNRSQFLP